MFEAAIFVFMLNGSPMKYTDTRGPYQTQEECEGRTKEMALWMVGKAAVMKLECTNRPHVEKPGRVG